MEKQGEPEICSAKDLSQLFDCSVMRISQLVKAGVLVKLARGQFDKDANTTAMIRHMRQTIRQQGSETSHANLKTKRAEYLDLQKKKAELDIAAKIGAVLPIDDVEAMFLEAAAIFSGQRRSMGSRLAGKLAGMHDPRAILALLNRENDGILKQTAAGFRDVPGVAKARRSTRSTAKKKPQPVGGRKPRATARKSRAGAVAK